MEDQTINVHVDGNAVAVSNGSTVAAAVFASGTQSFRRSIGNNPRVPLCGMGVCYECRVTIDGIRHRRSCQALAEEGMEVVTNGQDHD